MEHCRIQLNNNRIDLIILVWKAEQKVQFYKCFNIFCFVSVFQRQPQVLLKMDGGYQGTYQNGNAREADFQKLAQNIGTNIQKILQNGTIKQKFSYP